MPIYPIEALKHRYNTFINRQTPWSFFLGLSDYIDYMLEVPQFSEIVKKELSKRDREYQILDQYDDIAIQEMNDAKDKILDVVKEKKINANDFDRNNSFLPSVRRGGSENVVEQMKMFEDGVIGISGNKSDIIGNFLFDISANLLKMGYKKDVEEFLFSNEEYCEYYLRINGKDYDKSVSYNQRGNFIFSKNLPYRYEQTRKIEIQKKIEPWGAFEELIKIWHAKQEYSRDSSINETFINCENHHEYQLKRNEAYNVANIVNDIKIISENHRVLASQLEFFRIDDLVSEVARVHTILIEKTPIIKEENKKTDLLKILVEEISDAKNGIGKPIASIENYCQFCKQVLDDFEKRMSIAPPIYNTVYKIQDMEIDPTHKEIFEQMIEDLFLKKIITYKEALIPVEKRVIITSLPVREMFMGKNIVVINKRGLRQYADQLRKIIDSIYEKESKNETETTDPIKDISKIKQNHDIEIKGNFLIFGSKKVPIKKGQKSMTELFFKNAKIIRNNRTSKKGTILEIKNFIGANMYKNERKFRDGLKTLRGKIKDAEFPIVIDNPDEGKYQMVITYQ